MNTQLIQQWLATNPDISQLPIPVLNILEKLALAWASTNSAVLVTQQSNLTKIISDAQAQLDDVNAKITLLPVNPVILAPAQPTQVIP